MAPATVASAALAGIPGGLQAQGVWAGRRQLFVRFAMEGETATLYTAAALATELRRSTGRSAYHSISICGRDPLANLDYLRDALDDAATVLPVMLDSDGQRPERIAELEGIATLVQVTLEGPMVEAQHERAFASIKLAASSKIQQALAVVVDERTTDAQILRVIERAHDASETTAVVVHPPIGNLVDHDKRWTSLFERAAALHGDVRLAIRLLPPTGMR